MVLPSSKLGGMTIALHGQMYSAGSIGIVYTAMPEVIVGVQTSDVRGVIHLGPSYRYAEDRIPLRLEETPTDVAGLRAYRIVFARRDGVYRSLLVVVADSIEQLSQHVRVGDTNPRFRWDAAWFIRVGGWQAAP